MVEPPWAPAWEERYWGFAKRQADFDSAMRGFYFPVGESPTFPRVTRADPSLWSVIFRISVRAGRVLGAGLWSPFFNFPFGGAETGSIAYDTLLFLMRGITSNDFPAPLSACNFPARRKLEKYEPKHHATLRRAATRQ